jgi:TPR repeat protein
MPSFKECIDMYEKRVDANDSEAMCHLGMSYFEGDEVVSIKKDIDKAVNLFHRAAELGSAEACRYLGNIYYRGEGLNEDETKAKQYYEKAAMRGCSCSRFNLGCFEFEAGSFDRAIKHWLIAASGGDIRAVGYIKKAMVKGDATRDDYAQALRGCELYLEEVKSSQRDRAAAYSDKYKNLFEA